MKKASTEQLQELDRIAIEDFKIKSLTLMENAGRSVAKITIETLKEIQKAKVNVICGKGNNGGDGFVCARYLIDKRIKTHIFLIGKISQLKNDALINFNLMKDAQDIIEISDLSELERAKGILSDCDLLIDAIFGIGLKGDTKEPFKSVIEFLNNTDRPIISVDVPSGLDATTGEQLGKSIRATMTVTFSLVKRGFFINQGPICCGKIIVVDIGIPKELIDRYAR